MSGKRRFNKSGKAQSNNDDENGGSVKQTARGKLSSHVYYIGSSKQANDFNKTTDFLINHIRKTYEGGEEVAVALETRKEFDFGPMAPKPIRPNVRPLSSTLLCVALSQ